jgi:hypothetical protein
MGTWSRGVDNMTWLCCRMGSKRLTNEWVSYGYGALGNED